MLISPFSPVFFLGLRKSYGGECPFVQFFSLEDSIYVQVIRTSDEQKQLCMVHNIDKSYFVPSQSSTDSIGNGNYVDSYNVKFTTEGYYYLSIGDYESEPFLVTSNQNYLDRSVLIEYSPADNSTRNDVVPIIGEERRYFAFRVPGGFKPSGLDFSVDNEQFVAQSADIVELYAHESMQETLTVGWSRGVPIWFGQLLNRLLTCRYVYIDGRRYARYQSSVPEKEQTIEGVNAFVFTQKLQRINNLEPIKT